MSNEKHDYTAAIIGTAIIVAGTGLIITAMALGYKEIAVGLLIGIAWLVFMVVA